MNKSEKQPLESLGLDQLQRLRKIAEEEVALLRNNINALTTALERFSISLQSIQSLESSDKELMVPLTSSMYVKGRTDMKGKVMVDLGTGFYAKVTNQEGQAIINRKINYIVKNRKAFVEELRKKSEIIERIIALTQQRVKEQTS